MLSMVKTRGRVSFPHRDAVFGSEGSHSLDVLVRDVGGDHEDGGVGVTQLVAAVHSADGPALVGKTLLKRGRWLASTVGADGSAALKESRKHH